jgi:hypothetical protein
MKRLGVSKRGYESIIITQVTQVVFALMFFIVLFFFAKNSITGLSSYEEVLSKKIALIIDGASPGSVFYINIEKGLKFAKEAGVDCTQAACVYLDEQSGEVIVSFGSGPSYKYKYFSEFDVKLILNNGQLVIRVGEK